MAAIREPPLPGATFASEPSAILVTAKLVVVAEVPVALVKLKVVSVEEAVERKPFRKARVGEVACSLVPSLVKGQDMPPPAPPPSEPSQRSALPVIETQKSSQELPATPPKLKSLEMWKSVE